MKNVILVSILSIFLFSCKGPVAEKVAVVNNSTKVEAPEAKISFADPARIAGSNFGNFFISMVRTQNYDMALKFTSKATIEKFGEKSIKERFKNFSYNYVLDLKSSATENNITTLKFSTNEFATGKLKTIDIVVENDSCKLVLSDNPTDVIK